MNPLQETKVYVPVDINEEIPNGSTKNYPMIDEYHWLKEQSLFVFTREELENLLYSNYRTWHIQFYRATSTMTAREIDDLLKERWAEYIKQLLT